MEGKGLTKGMQLLFGKKSIVLKLDCCVCGEWVVCNFIQCRK